MKDHMEHGRSSQYKENSITLVGAISMGTGVMIGAEILALTGQKLLNCQGALIGILVFIGEKLFLRDIKPEK